MRPFLILAALLLAGLAMMPPSERAQAAQVDAGSGYELENVEVLDPSMRLADARVYMKQMNDALGVECRDCHDLKNFASDAKPLKLVAREMMKMERDLNARWFAEATEPRITCWTCHRGERIPPALESAGSSGEEPAEN